MELPTDANLFFGAVSTLFAFCPPIFLALQFITAPYGRHYRAGWGFSLPPSLGWFLMESPAIWVTLLVLPHGRLRSHPLAMAIVIAYLLHYFNRSVVHPMRLLRSPTKGPNLPVSVAFLAFCFNVVNAYAQTRASTHYTDYPRAGEISIWVWARVATGFGLFFWGMTVNMESDRILLRLKKEAGGEYVVPKGGWFELVSCPNYMGEVVEWLGWAVAAGTPAAFGFFLCTCANLIPRAVAHRRWYLEKFGNSFPSSRRAVIPFII